MTMETLIEQGSQSSEETRVVVDEVGSVENSTLR